MNNNSGDDLYSWVDTANAADAHTGNAVSQPNASTKSLSPLVNTYVPSDMFDFGDPILDSDARAINNIFNLPEARPSIPSPSPSPSPSPMFPIISESTVLEPSSFVPDSAALLGNEVSLERTEPSSFVPASSSFVPDSASLSTALERSPADATEELLRNLKARMANLNQTELNEKLEDIDANIARIISEGGSHSEIMAQLKLLENGTNLLVKRSEQKNKIKSHLSRYYANLCAVGTYLNPDVNRVVATIEAGASLALISNQVLPFMRPFGAATPFLSTLAVGALVADMGIRRHTSGGSLRSVVEPLIEKVVPLCSVVANGVCNTLDNTRTGRYIKRKGKRTVKKFKKGIEKAKQLGRDISEGTSSLASSAASWADRTGRRTLRAAFDPVNTIGNAINFCKDTLRSLSEPHSRVVIPADSRSSSVSSNSSIASDVREELMENNPFTMSRKEVLDEINSMAREDKYSYDSSSSVSSLLGNKRKGNSSDDTRRKRRRHGGLKSLKN